MPKLPPPPRKPPEQLGVLGVASVNEPSVRSDDVCCREVVARQTELPHRPADPATEREPGDAGGRHEAARCREPVGLGLMVDVGPHRASTDSRPLGDGIDAHVPFIGERSITIPSSTVENPARLWPPPRTAIVRSLLRAKPTAAITSAAPVQRDDERRGVPVVRAVPDPGRLRVAVIGRGHDFSPRRLLAAPELLLPRAPGRLCGSCPSPFG